MVRRRQFSRNLRRFAGALGDAAGQMLIPSLVQQAAAKYGVDPALALAVARRESGFNQAAVSRAGAIGVMQLEPATAAQYGADPYIATQNIDAGVHYLSDLLNRYGGNLAKALAAYNWGPGNLDRAVAQYGDAWLTAAPEETQAYVAAIAGVQPSPPPVPAPLTIDAATGQVIEDATDIFTPAPAGEQISTSQKALVLTAAGFAVYFLADLLD